MAGVRVERDVGHHAEFGELLLERAAGAADQVALVERLAAFLVLEAALEHQDQYWSLANLFAAWR